MLETSILTTSPIGNKRSASAEKKEHWKTTSNRRENGHKRLNVSPDFDKENEGDYENLLSVQKNSHHASFQHMFKEINLEELTEKQDSSEKQNDSSEEYFELVNYLMHVIQMFYKASEYVCVCDSSNSEDVVKELIKLDLESKIVKNGISSMILNIESKLQNDAIQDKKGSRTEVNSQDLNKRLETFTQNICRKVMAYLNSYSLLSILEQVPPELSEKLERLQYEYEDLHDKIKSKIQGKSPKVTEKALELEKQIAALRELSAQFECEKITEDMIQDKINVISEFLQEFEMKHLEVEKEVFVSKSTHQRNCQ